MKRNKLFLTAGLAAVIAIGIFIYALNNSKFEVKFDTNGGNKIETVTVKKNERVEAPKDPKKKGYVFVEWQKNGKTYDFKKKVTENMTLKAKWLPEIYVTVTLDSNGGSDLEPVQIVSGSKLSKDELEKPTREGYTFAGWLIGENKYDFNKKITSNLTLTASWVEGENVEIPDEEEEAKKQAEEEKKAKEEAKKAEEEEKKAEEEAKKAEEEAKKAEEEAKKAEEKKAKEEEKKAKEEAKKAEEEAKKADESKKAEDKKETSTSTAVTTTFKVVDYVIITGEYAGSCDGENPGNTAAMDWDRQILAVYENQEYPYQVGNNFGITGYFKADSLKMKD